MIVRFEVIRELTLEEIEARGLTPEDFEFDEDEEEEEGVSFGDEDDADAQEPVEDQNESPAGLPSQEEESSFETSSQDEEETEEEEDDLYDEDYAEEEDEESDIYVLEGEIALRDADIGRIFSEERTNEEVHVFLQTTYGEIVRLKHSLDEAITKWTEAVSQSK